MHTPTTPSPASRPAAPVLDSPGQAVATLCAHLHRVPTEAASLASAVGRFLATPAVTDRPSPASSVSAMDGYALATCDLPAPSTYAPQTPLTSLTLRVCATGRIGAAPPPLERGCAVRVVTGGAVPTGADAVLKRESVLERGDAIDIPPATRATLRPGLHVRHRGENAPAGATIAPAGALITSPLAGALATFGIDHPTVRRRVRVAVLVTGDEVLRGHATPTDFQLRDSNGPVLSALLEALPFVAAAPPLHAGDDLDPTREALRMLLLSADCVLITGGVSMGDRDHVPAALAELGATTLFHGVRQRPGRPLLGAVGRTGQAVLALPGNPISALVTARRVALPVLQHLAGGTPTPLAAALVLTNPPPPTTAIDLWHHRLVQITQPGHARLIEATGSGDVFAAATSDGFVEVPPSVTGPGPFPFWPWNGV
jgi:molybdopterin molybdotransferase